MRLRVFLPVVIAALLALGAACGGGNDESENGNIAGTTPIPTATPYARVPDPTIVSGPAAPPPTEVTYIVEAGDGLSLIAERFGTTVEAIMERNGLTDPQRIFVGQELIIPDADADDDAAGGSGDETGDDNDDQPSSGPQTYIVVAGDTASEIAERFGITVEELAAANGLTVTEANDLQVGQELSVPEAP